MTAAFSSPLSASAAAPLGSGTKAGIGLGCAIAGLLAVLAMTWTIIVTKRLRRVQRPGQNEKGYIDSHQGGKTEKDGNEVERCVKNVKASRSECETHGARSVPELETHRTSDIPGNRILRTIDVCR